MAHRLAPTSCLRQPTAAHPCAACAIPPDYRVFQHVGVRCSVRAQPSFPRVGPRRSRTGSRTYSHCPCRSPSCGRRDAVGTGDVFMIPTGAIGTGDASMTPAPLSPARRAPTADDGDWLSPAMRTVRRRVLPPPVHWFFVERSHNPQRCLRPSCPGDLAQAGQGWPALARRSHEWRSRAMRQIPRARRPPAEADALASSPTGVATPEADALASGPTGTAAFAEADALGVKPDRPGGPVRSDAVLHALKVAGSPPARG